MSAGFVDRLAAADEADLLALARIRSYPPRSTVFFEGDDAHDVVIVRSGEVKVAVTSPEGREIVLDVVGPGNILGELSAIDGAPRSATASAVSTVEAAVIPLPRFNDFIATHPAAAGELLRSLAARLRATSRRQVEFGTVDAIGRVCGRLIEMTERYGTSGEAGITITAPLSQQEIAGWAGLSREAVVKALHDLRVLGWITSKGRLLTVVDVDAVRTRAGHVLD